MPPTPDLRLVKSNETQAFDSESLLSRVTILGERSGGLVDAMVPAELIFREDVPVDDAHVEELASSIQLEAEKGQGTGQLSPVLLGDVAGHEKFPIIDGFHRDAALHRIGMTDIFATIRRHSSMEDVVDLRILTANTHASVNFSRVVEWITEAWNRSQWAEKISVVQAFALTKTSSSGKILGLSPQETEEVKSWVMDKCEKWRMSPSTVHVNLATAELADPELIKAARRRVGGHALETVTPQHLGVIAKGLPRMYAEQRLVVSIAMAHNMNIPSTRAVVNLIKQARSFEEAEEMAVETDWSKVVPAYSKSRQRELNREAQEKGGEEKSASAESVAHKLVLTELLLGRASLENIVHRGEYVPVAPHHPVSSNLQIDVDGDPAIAELIGSCDVEANVEDFLELNEKIHPQLQQSLESQTHLGDNEVRALIREASHRVVIDLESGDLRLVRVQQESSLRGLLVGCIRDELALRRNPYQLYVAPSDAQDTWTEPVDEAVIAAPYMSESVRKAMILRAILGLSVSSTAQLLKKDAATIPHLLHDAHSIIAQTRQRRENNILHKLSS